MIISLHGSMAIGKTTTVLEIGKALGNKVSISLESIAHISRLIKEHGYNKNTIDGYCKIQKLFIENEIRRYKLYKDGISFFDSGLESIEFYTLYYPKAIGQNWNIECLLNDELKALRVCKSDYIIYLDADIDTIIERKHNDMNRSRDFFDFHMKYMLNKQRAWFESLENVIFINCNDKTPYETADEILINLRSKGIEI